MGEHLPRIRVRDHEGHLLFREALCLRLYVPRRHQDIVPSILRSLDRYLAVAGHSLTRYVDDEGEVHPLDDRGWNRVRTALTSLPSANADLWDDDPVGGGHGFYYRGSWGLPKSTPAMCTMYAWLPTEYLEEHGSEHLMKVAIELLGDLPISSGNLGLAMNQAWSEEGHQRVAGYYHRHPGISLVSHLEAHPELGAGVNDVSWLTFLGQPVLSEVGGTAGLRARLHSPDTTVTEISGARVMIRLGAWPEAGDLQQGQNLTAYRELARVLEPWLLRSDPRWYWQLFSPEELRRWEHRFLD
jgi:hypothetical protein